MKSKKKKNVRINVIPILDAVFIFIFFLLMSAQFIDVYELETEVPKVSTVKEDSKVIPLNLTLKIKPEEIVVMTGLEGKVVDKIGKIDGGYDLDKLNRQLIKIKQAHLNEDSVVLRPDKTIAYKDIIGIIDSVKTSRFGQIKDTREPSSARPSDKLFGQVIFETIL